MKAHFFDGDKGGVGKTFICDAVIQLLRQMEIDFIPVEADRDNADIYKRNQDLKFEFAVFSENEYEVSADKLVDWAAEKTVVVSLPGQVKIALEQWLKEAHQALKGAELDKEIQFVRWFVCSGSDESVSLFSKSLAATGDLCQFVLIKNNGAPGSPLHWRILEQSPGLAELMKKHKVKTMEVPRLSGNEAAILANLSKDKVGFSKVLSHPDVSLLAKSRIRQFLGQVHEQVGLTGLLP